MMHHNPSIISLSFKAQIRRRLMKIFIYFAGISLDQPILHFMRLFYFKFFMQGRDLIVRRVIIVRT